MRALRFVGEVLLVGTAFALFLLCWSLLAV